MSEQWYFNFRVFEAKERLNRDIYATWLELGMSSATFGERYSAKWKLERQIEETIYSISIGEND